MSKRLPFMPLPVAEHLAATNHLTLEEIGALDRLLFHYWFSGKPLPNSDKILAKLLGIRPQTFRRIFPKLEDFFEVSNSQLMRPEMEELLAETLERSGKLSEAGRRGAVKRWSNNDSQANSNKTKQNIITPLPPQAGEPRNDENPLQKNSRAHGTNPRAFDAREKRRLKKLAEVERRIEREVEDDWAQIHAVDYSEWLRSQETKT